MSLQLDLWPQTPQEPEQGETLWKQIEQEAQTQAIAVLTRLILKAVSQTNAEGNTENKERHHD